MKPPKYVKMGGKVALRLDAAGEIYHRPAGAWDVGYLYNEKGVLLSVSEQYGWLNGIELIECTREQFAEDNHGYLPKNY